jgi:hypothetical protein
VGDIDAFESEIFVVPLAVPGGDDDSVPLEVNETVAD